MSMFFDRRLLAFAFGMGALTTRGTDAQMPGAPVLQNAFSNPGITAAVNIASLGGASTYGAAGAWAPGSGRFQLSGGAAVQTRSSDSGRTTRTAYGVRVNVPVYGATKSVGASIFAGYGGLAGSKLDSTVAKTLIPLGATVSYRSSLGMARGFSLYGSPVYELVTRGGGAGNTSVLRGALGLDVGLTSSIGVTLGVELGAKQDAGTAKPSGTAFGAGISILLGG